MSEVQACVYIISGTWYNIQGGLPCAKMTKDPRGQWQSTEAGARPLGMQSFPSYEHGATAQHAQDTGSTHTTYTVGAYRGHFAAWRALAFTRLSEVCDFAKIKFRRRRPGTEVAAWVRAHSVLFTTCGI